MHVLFLLRSFFFSFLCVYMFSLVIFFGFCLIFGFFFPPPLHGVAVCEPINNSIEKQVIFS